MKRGTGGGDRDMEEATIFSLQPSLYFLLLINAHDAAAAAAAAAADTTRTTATAPPPAAAAALAAVRTIAVATSKESITFRGRRLGKKAP